MKERPNWIDYAKVFMIYFVVLGHYTYVLGLDFKPSSVWNIMKIITLFHMPFFFIVSGFLFKSIPVFETIKKGWIQLMRPYLLMCGISCVIMVVIDLASRQFSFKNSASLAIGVLTSNDGPYSSPTWSSALWFCYSLFLIKIAFSVIKSVDNKIVRWGEAVRKLNVS